jgi:3-oxoacyl-[acyl-carrier protein] reductase
MFEDKVAVITGSGGGIGRATAELLGEGGANVVVSDIDGDAARETAAAIAGETAVHVGDLMQGGAADELISTAIDAFGRIDILVNNAGHLVGGPVHKTSDDDLRAMLEMHTVVPFQVLRAAAPYVRDRARRQAADGQDVFRKVVNVASMAAFGSPGLAAYSIAKAGVIGLTKTLAREWGPFKVNVNAVAFAVIETRMAAQLEPRAKEAVRATVPLGRMGTVREAGGRHRIPMLAVERLRVGTGPYRLRRPAGRYVRLRLRRRARRSPTRTSR